MVEVLHPSAIWQRRDAIVGNLQRGLERGGGSDKVTAEWLLGDAIAGNGLMFVHGDSMACYAKVTVYPECKTLFCYAIGGEDRDEWLTDLQDMLLAAAWRLGCRTVEFAGRAGWEKVLGPHGWKKTAIHMTLEV